MFRPAAIGLFVASAGGALLQPSSECSSWVRRSEAIRLARNINSLENGARVRSKRFVALSDLQVAAPEAFEVQLSTDGATYTFSVKDTADPCHRAVFSDQVGVIYTADPLR